MTVTFTMGTETLGPGRPPWIVAEIGVNHDGRLERAMDSIDAAAGAGADAVKFQTFRTEEFMADRDLRYAYRTATGVASETMFAMFKRLELPPSWHAPLRDRAAARGLTFLSSAADPASADLLVGLGVPALKIASEDLINAPLLEHVAAAGLPVILSTGMADAGEIDDAVGILERGGVRELLLLHCVSLYPTPDVQANLRRMTTLAARYGRPVGLSDHTRGSVAAVAATVAGAVMIEKHFTLDRCSAARITSSRSIRLGSPSSSETSTAPRPSSATRCSRPRATRRRRAASSAAASSRRSRSSRAPR